MVSILQVHRPMSISSTNVNMSAMRKKKSGPAANHLVANDPATSDLAAVLGAAGRN